MSNYFVSCYYKGLDTVFDAQMEKRFGPVCGSGSDLKYRDLEWKFKTPKLAMRIAHNLKKFRKIEKVQVYHWAKDDFSSGDELIYDLRWERPKKDF